MSNAVAHLSKSNIFKSRVIQYDCDVADHVAKWKIQLDTS